MSGRPQQYVITASEVDLLEQRASVSSVALPPREGFIRLYNKNAMTTHFARRIGQVQDRCEYIVEMDDVPEYFKNVLRPHSGRGW